MSRVWIFQDPKQVAKHGAAKASWYVGWYDPAGKQRCQSCGPFSRGKGLAEKLKKKREAELLTGTYQSNDKKTWKEFREEFRKKILSKKVARTRAEMETALEHFERIISPHRMSAIKTQTIDDFVAKRRQEAGKKEGDLVSPATVNKDLRHLRAAIRKAAKWGYIPKLPDFEFEKEPKRLPLYVTAEHFAEIYAKCDKAKLPNDLPYPAEDWWRNLIVLAYMTGWRISEILAMKRTDLDLSAGTAVTRAEDNKGGRDDIVKLHPVVIEHLKKLAAFDPHVFPWNHNRRTLHTEFARIQEAAGIKLCARKRTRIRGSATSTGSMTCAGRSPP
jgi:integrase